MAIRIIIRDLLLTGRRIERGDQFHARVASRSTVKAWLLSSIAARSRTSTTRLILLHGRLQALFRWSQQDCRRSRPAPARPAAQVGSRRWNIFEREAHIVAKFQWAANWAGAGAARKSARDSEDATRISCCPFVQYGVGAPAVSGVFDPGEDRGGRTAAGAAGRWQPLGSRPSIGSGLQSKRLPQPAGRASRQ